MNAGDLGDMQRYLVEEEAEHWRMGLITRRDFIRRVTLIVGGAAAASGVLFSLGCDTSTPEPTPISLATPTVGSAGSTSPYHIDENDPSIHSEMVDIPATAQGLKLRGYLAYDKGRAAEVKLGGVLVQHENKGLTDYIKDVVRRVAKAGYVGLCVDLLSRAGAATPTLTKLSE